MYKLLLAVVVVLSIVVAGPSYAQFGGLGDKVKKAAEEKAGDVQKPGAGERPPARTDLDRPYPPGLSFSSLLNGVVMLPKDGRLHLDHIQATFIPDDCEGGFVVLRTAEGEELYQWDWRPDRLEKPYTLFNIHSLTDLRSGETLSAHYADLSTPGDYVLDFYLPTEHFYTYPFSVMKIGGDDPFGDGQCYVMDGDWSDWGYLYYSDANPEQSLQWKIWLQNDACKEEDIKVRVEINRDADGDLVCTSREYMTNSVQPKWIRLAFDMVFPEGKDVPHGTYFKAKDLLATDGAYTLTMKIDDAPYGTWKFAVENGKLNYVGRSLRGEADPLTFVEGGRDAWWYAKQ
jgi:hypothetical protein